jgi:hypothetical protein
MAYSDDDRVLDIKGLITYPDTATQAITSTHISSFVVDEDAGEDVPVGAAPAASFELKLDNSSGQWEPGGSILGVHILDGAKVEIEIGLWNGATYDYSNIGTYYVDDVQGQERETLIRLKGSDAMVSLMSEYYADAPGDYPQTLGDLLTDIATTAGVTLESAVFTNSAVSIPSQPVWRNDLTCREAAGYIAACAGGIALFNRDGKLEIIALETVSSWSIGTSVYKTFTRGDTFFGALNAINVYTYGAPDGTAPTRYATAPATPDTSLNSINIKGNPILAYGSTALASLGAGMLAALTGLYFRGATFKWHGDPTMVLGDLCTVTDLAATAIPVLVTKQKISFGPGFGMDSGCEVTTSTKADASGKLQKIFTPTGNLNAEALAGNIYVRAGELMTLESGGNLNVESGADIHVQSGGDIAVEASGRILVKADGIISIASGGDINIASGGTFTVASSNFGIDSSGNVTVKGAITANSGYIGGTDGFTIASQKMYTGSKSSFYSNAAGIYIATNGIALGGDGTTTPFKVSSDGALTATNATITGAITATSGSFTGSLYSSSGTIGGFTLASGSLSAQASGKPLLKLDTSNSEITLGGLKISFSDTTGCEFISEYPVVVETNESFVVKDDTNSVTYFYATNASAWCNGNMSAGSFTDRTPFYDGDAVKELKKIKGNGKGIDHDTLPEFARASIKYTKHNKDGTKEEIIEDGRDLGAMISILTKAVQELDARLDKLEAINGKGI